MREHGYEQAESKLEGTWVRAGEDPDVYILNKDGTCKNGKFNEGGTVSGDEGTWSATNTDLSIRMKIPEDYFQSLEPFEIKLTPEGKLDMGGMVFSRISSSGNSVEGTWKATNERIEVIAEINTNSWTMTHTYLNSTQEDEYIGSREGNTLTLKEGVSMITAPYKLDGNTLTFDGTTYTKQQ